MKKTSAKKLDTPEFHAAVGEVFLSLFIFIQDEWTVLMIL